MARDQAELQVILQEIVGEDVKVYFQPTTNINMQYPCLVYERDAGDTKHADNAPYKFAWRYQIKWIDRDPESPVLRKIAALPSCSYDRFYTAEDLNHDVFNIYF
jgi:hypothetical protein